MPANNDPYPVNSGEGRCSDGQEDQKEGHVQGKIGRLTVITGCMSSGKTEELLRLLRRRTIAGESYKVFKHTMDDRTPGEYIESRAGHVQSAVVVRDGDIPVDIDVDNVAIEEAQFFDYQLVDSINTMLDAGQDVFVTGLNQDFRGEPFGIMPDIMAMADKLILLTAVCKQCGKEATMTQRLVGGKPAAYNAEQILIGGDESYEARCRDCHRLA